MTTPESEREARDNMTSNHRGLITPKEHDEIVQSYKDRIVILERNNSGMADWIDIHKPKLKAQEAEIRFHKGGSDGFERMAKDLSAELQAAFAVIECARLIETYRQYTPHEEIKNMGIFVNLQRALKELDTQKDGI